MNATAMRTEVAASPGRSPIGGGAAARSPIDGGAAARSPIDGGAAARSPIDRLLRFLEKCAGNAFFGKVTVTFQSGRVCDVKIEQTRKLDEL